MPDIRHHAAEHIQPDEVTSLHALGTQLATEAQDAHAGRAGRTVIALPGLRATLIALNEGSELAEHKAPGAATLLCLSGQATLTAGERGWQLRAHDTVAIPNALHSLRADTDAIVLLTVRLD